jgi:ribosomal-protein-serine acetyltransferase
LTQIPVDTDTFIRPLRLEEAGLIYALIDANRDYIGRFLPWCTPTYSLEDARKFIVQTNEAQEKGDNAGGAIFHKGVIAGDIGIRGLRSADRSAEIGYWLAENMQGKGIMTRACRALIDLSFRKHGLHRVTIRAATGNARSRAVPVRLGFTHEGAMREATFAEGRYQDLEVYSVLDREWSSRI